MTLVPPLPYIGRKQQVGLFRNKSTSSIFWGKKVQKNFHEKHFQNMQKSIVCKKVLFVETTHGRLSRQIMPLFWRFYFILWKKWFHEFLALFISEIMCFLFTCYIQPRRFSFDNINRLTPFVFISFSVPSNFRRFGTIFSKNYPGMVFR